VKKATVQGAKGGERRAFTLMEMLAVIGIVCLLAVLVLGITGHAQRAAREARAKAELELIRSALQEHMLKDGTYPETTTWTNSAITNWLPSGFTFQDPWGNPYRYACGIAESYTLYSTGQNVTNSNDDIVSGR